MGAMIYPMGALSEKMESKIPANNPKCKIKHEKMEGILNFSLIAIHCKQHHSYNRMKCLSKRWGLRSIQYEALTLSRADAAMSSSLQQRRRRRILCHDQPPLTAVHLRGRHLQPPPPSTYIAATDFGSIGDHRQNPNLWWRNNIRGHRRLKMKGFSQFILPPPPCPRYCPVRKKCGPNGRGVP